jgi:hypothetical protein
VSVGERVRETEIGRVGALVLGEGTNLLIVESINRVYY